MLPSSSASFLTISVENVSMRTTINIDLFEKGIFFFTVRKRSCGKVMFLHLSVSHSVHRGSTSVHAGIHPPGQTPPWADTPPGQTPPSRRPLQRTVRILLECFLVSLQVLFN